MYQNKQKTERVWVLIHRAHSNIFTSCFPHAFPLSINRALSSKSRKSTRRLILLSPDASGAKSTDGRWYTSCAVLPSRYRVHGTERKCVEHVRTLTNRGAMSEEKKTIYIYLEKTKKKCPFYYKCVLRYDTPPLWRCCGVS